MADVIDLSSDDEDLVNVESIQNTTDTVENLIEEFISLVKKETNNVRISTVPNTPYSSDDEIEIVSEKLAKTRQIVLPIPPDFFKRVNEVAKADPESQNVFIRSIKDWFDQGEKEKRFKIVNHGKEVKVKMKGNEAQGFYHQNELSSWLEGLLSQQIVNKPNIHEGLLKTEAKPKFEPPLPYQPLNVDCDTTTLDPTPGTSAYTNATPSIDQNFQSAKHSVSNGGIHFPMDNENSPYCHDLTTSDPFQESDSPVEIIDSDSSNDDSDQNEAPSGKVSSYSFVSTLKNGRPTNGRMICKKRAFYQAMEGDRASPISDEPMCKKSRLNSQMTNSGLQNCSSIEILYTNDQEMNQNGVTVPTQEKEPTISVAQDKLENDATPLTNGEGASLKSAATGITKLSLKRRPNGGHFRVINSKNSNSEKLVNGQVRHICKPFSTSPRNKMMTRRSLQSFQSSLKPVSNGDTIVSHDTVKNGDAVQSENQVDSQSRINKKRLRPRKDEKLLLSKSTSENKDKPGVSNETQKRQMQPISHESVTRASTKFLKTIDFKNFEGSINNVFVSLDLFDNLFRNFDRVFNLAELIQIFGPNISTEFLTNKSRALTHMSLKVASTILTIMGKYPPILFNGTFQLAIAPKVILKRDDISLMIKQLKSNKKSQKLSPVNKVGKKGGKSKSSLKKLVKPMEQNGTTNLVQVVNKFSSIQLIPKYRNLLLTKSKGENFGLLLDDFRFDMNNRVLVNNSGQQFECFERKIKPFPLQAEEEEDDEDFNLLSTFRPARKFAENSVTVWKHPQNTKGSEPKVEKKRLNVHIPTFTLSGLQETAPPEIIPWFVNKIMVLKGLAENDSCKAKSRKLNPVKTPMKHCRKGKPKSSTVRLKVQVPDYLIDTIIDLTPDELPNPDDIQNPEDLRNLKNICSIEDQMPIGPIGCHPTPSTSSNEKTQQLPKQDLTDQYRNARKIERLTFHFAGKKNVLHPSTRIPPGWMRRVLQPSGLEQYVRLKDGRIEKSLAGAFKQYLIDMHER